MNRYLLSNEFNGIFIFHAEFNQSQGDQDGCSTKSGYAMHGHTRSRFSTGPATNSPKKTKQEKKNSISVTVSVKERKTVIIK